MLKRRFGDRVSQHGGIRQFDTPQLFVWFKRLGTNAVLDTVLYGKLAAGAGDEGGVPSRIVFNRTAMTWSCGTFPVFPRRDRTLQCLLYNPTAARHGLPAVAARVNFPNPAYGHFGEWQPEPLPAVKQSGELEIGLNQVVAASQPLAALPLQPIGANEPPRSDMETYAHFAYSITSTRGTNETWGLHKAELGDITGNMLAGKVPASATVPANNGGLIDAYIRDGLWPDEAAWRLKLDFKSRLGFRAGADRDLQKRSPPGRWRLQHVEPGPNRGRDQDCAHGNRAPARHDQSGGLVCQV